VHNSGFAGFEYSAKYEVGLVLELKVINHKINLDLIPKPAKSFGNIGAYAKTE